MFVRLALALGLDAKDLGDGIDTARRADHPRSADLTVILLLDLAHQALHLRRPDEALRLVQLAAATATSRKYPVCASSRSYIAATLAWCHAFLGDAEPCERALGDAQQFYPTPTRPPHRRGPRM